MGVHKPVSDHRCASNWWNGRVEASVQQLSAAGRSIGTGRKHEFREAIRETQVNGHVRSTHAARRHKWRPQKVPEASRPSTLDLKLSALPPGFRGTGGSARVRLKLSSELCRHWGSRHLKLRQKRLPFVGFIRVGKSSLTPSKRSQ